MHTISNKTQSASFIKMGMAYIYHKFFSLVCVIDKINGFSYLVAIVRLIKKIIVSS